MIRSIALCGALLTLACHGRECDDPCERDAPADRSGPRRARDHGYGREGCPVGATDDAGATGALDATSADAVVAAEAGAPDAGSGGCRVDRDCAAAGTGLICDARSGACVTPTECATSASCAAGEQCLAGRCLAPAAVCQFATDCGGGRDCVDGRCLSPCSASAACPATQACVAGYCDQPTSAGGACARAADCASGSACADGRCVAACDGARPCAAGEACVLGFCQVDSARRSFCTTDADCAAGSVCHRGACRAACPGGTTEECLRVDVAFDTCGADHLCTNPLELRPECARSADCAAATVCINARCR